MRHYETIYIMNPNLGEEEYQEVLGKFSSFIEENKGVIIKTSEWGKQRLAYLIQKFNYGSYVLIEFCANADLTAELERAFKLDDRILKCQTVKLADRVDPEELLRKEKEAQEKSSREEEAAEEETAAQEEAEEAGADETVTESTDSEVENGVSEK